MQYEAHGSDTTEAMMAVGTAVAKPSASHGSSPAACSSLTYLLIGLVVSDRDAYEDWDHAAEESRSSLTRPNQHDPRRMCDAISAFVRAWSQDWIKMERLRRRLQDWLEGKI